MKCFLCLHCYEKRTQMSRTVSVSGTNPDGARMKPTGLDGLKGHYSVGYYLSMVHWSVERPDGTWAIAEWAPKAVCYKGVGNGQVAGPCDPIGLFGSEVQFVPQRLVRDVEAIGAECKDRPLMDLSGVDTPPTPP